MSDRRDQPPPKEGLSVATLFYGIVVIFVLLLFAGAITGVGSVALLGWFLLLLGWVAYWTSRRRR